MVSQHWQNLRTQTPEINYEAQTMWKKKPR